MKRILIIDDESNFCEMLKIRLESHDYNVLIAHDGKEGIKKAKAENPDIILMDIMMPNLSGGDAVRILKDDWSTNLIPVIFLTAAVSKEEEDVGQRVNIDNTFFPAISKPFNPDDLLAKIGELIGE